MMNSFETIKVVPNGMAMRGLTTQEAKERRQKYGSNELPRYRSPWIIRMLAYFLGPVPIAFIVAIAICLVARLRLEAEIVGLGFVGFAWVGCMVESAAQIRVLKLRAKLRGTVCVCRDDTWQTLSVKELVPGDMIRIRCGDIVPADVHLAGGDAVGINVIHPTVNVTRIFQCGDFLYHGSPINFGDAYAIVYATGADTQLGQKVKRLVQELTAHYFYENAFIKLDRTLLHFEEPLGGERAATDPHRD